MSSTQDEPRFDPAAIGDLYRDFATPLRAFLTGLLRNRDLAEESLQATFEKAVRGGHEVEPASFRGWLFQVAYREAMALRRRQGIEARAIQKLSLIGKRDADGPSERIARHEARGRVQKALEELPAEQQEVVRRRIYDDQTFADIASELQLPLGTVLTRMRLALSKLRKILNEPE